MKQTFVDVPVNLVDCVNDISMEFLGAALSRKTTDKLYLQDGRGFLKPYTPEMPSSEIVFDDISTAFFLGEMEDDDIVEKIIKRHCIIHEALVAKMDLDDIKDGLESHPKNYKLVNMDEYVIIKRDIHSDELKRNLCDLLGLNYHTSIDNIANELRDLLY